MIPLERISQLYEIDLYSENNPVLIFKHSIRCSTSAVVLNRFEQDYTPDEQKQLPVYYLDLIRFRELSNEIASRYNIEHESPQSLLISHGKCIYNASHFDIELSEIKSKI